MMEFEFIEYVKMESGIGRIYLNRPEKRNALCNPLRTELFTCLETLDKDHEIKVIILSGKGSCFCAGYDYLTITVKICHITLVKRMAFGQGM